MRQGARVLIPRGPVDPRSSVGHVGAAGRWYLRPDARAAPVLPGHRRPIFRVVEMEGSQGVRRLGDETARPLDRSGWDREQDMSNGAATLICITAPTGAEGPVLSRARLSEGP